MELKDALRGSMEENGFTREAVAVAAGGSASAVSKWLSGEATPRLERYQRLRANVPGFADRMDGKVAA